jgi:hypothetical protein
MASPRVAHCVFCDDIRQEIGNKISLMGIYSGEMIFPVKPPVVLPKFGIVAWVIADIDDPIQTISVSLNVPPNLTEILRTESGPIVMVPSTVDGAKKMITQQMLPISQLVISEAGMIEVMIHTERETLRGGRIMIRFAAEPAAPGA